MLLYILPMIAHTYCTLYTCIGLKQLLYLFDHCITDGVQGITTELPGWRLALTYCGDVSPVPEHV